MRCAMHCICRIVDVNAVITPVYWYFHCDFPQNIALFSAISDFVLLLLFAYASCLFNRPNGNADKKLSYCWETVRRESMPRIAQMDVEMTTKAE